MRQIFPLGDYVRRTGDTMTGPLTIKRDTTTITDAFLKLQCKSSAGQQMPIGFYDEGGTLTVLIRGDRWGNLELSPKKGATLAAPWADVGAPVYWRPHPFPASLSARRVMMVENRLFGRR